MNLVAARQRALGQVAEHQLARSVATHVTHDQPGWVLAALLEARLVAQRRLDGDSREDVITGLRALQTGRVSAALERLGVDRFRAVLVALGDQDHEAVAGLFPEPADAVAAEAALAWAGESSPHTLPILLAVVTPEAGR